MKLNFKDTDFTVVIGANPFDDIVKVSNCIIEFIKHKSFIKFETDLKNVNAIIEVRDIIDVEAHTTYTNSSNDAEDDSNITYTIKTSGNGILDTNDNDKLHTEWLLALGDYLTTETVERWQSKANIPESALEHIIRTI